VPLIYAGIFDGLGHDRWGAGGLLYTDAALGVAGVALFMGVALTTHVMRDGNGPPKARQLAQISQKRRGDGHVGDARR
jgi:hypothetical protein